ncbi:hypothetical protein NJB18091_18670 [Mycobacterium marinum]|nr:hypothetical protein NJB18091_18670 [Mycobacterium marinum]
MDIRRASLKPVTISPVLKSITLPHLKMPIAHCCWLRKDFDAAVTLHSRRPWLSTAAAARVAGEKAA